LPHPKAQARFRPACTKPFAATAPMARAIRSALLLGLAAPTAARLGAPVAAGNQTDAASANTSAALHALRHAPVWEGLAMPQRVQLLQAHGPAAIQRGGPGRGADFWTNMTLAASVAVESDASAAGFAYVATTTQYADTATSSCGKMDTAALVAGTGYYAVASAQAMQNSFPQGGCCWCGESTQGEGTAPMGCSSCAKGRFLPKHPYGQAAPGESALFEREINIVVADICPHKGNEAWCPESKGSTNTFGSKNHFDFAHPPAGFDNFYFAFTPTACSGEIEQRLSKMSQCAR